MYLYVRTDSSSNQSAKGILFLLQVMHFKSLKISLALLGITAIVFSRGLFFFFDDPEGPNLLIVIVLAAALYVASLAPYLFRVSNANKFLLALCIQLALVVGLYGVLA